jgi:TatD family-associated radical SAM protein
MEENEKKQVQNGGEGGRTHGRRRRHRHGKGHGGNGNNGGNANNGNVGNNAQEQKGQKQNAPQGVNNGAQKGQGKAQQQKNKQPMPQKGQSQPQTQPQKGQNAPQSQPNQQGKNKQKNKNEKKVEQQPRKDTYVYVLEGKIYLNLTNKCSNGCDFCVRNERASYYGNYLWLQKGEPTAAQVIAQINGMGDLKRFKEAVFCGFGEPTYRMEVMREVADYLHEKGLSTRLNTNGQGCLINKRDIVPELIGKIDLVNVSLNASCYEKYQKICRSMFREAGFDGMVEFAKSCKRQGVNVRFSIVDCIGEEEVEACKRLASKVNVPLYIRDYITDS